MELWKVELKAEWWVRQKVLNLADLKVQWMGVEMVATQAKIEVVEKELTQVAMMVAQRVTEMVAELEISKAVLLVELPGKEQVVQKVGLLVVWLVVQWGENMVALSAADLERTQVALLVGQRDVWWVFLME